MRRSRQRRLGLMVAIGTLATLAVPGAALGTTVTYSYAGNVSQQFTVPAGITQLTVTAIGAPGGWQQGSTAAAANGGEVTGTLTGVTPNSVYTIVVGFEGSASTISSPNGTNGGGFNGGGGAGEGGYGGGGASTVCAPGVSPCSNTNGLIVAAGGGGVAGQNRGGAGGQTGGDASPVNPSDPAVAQGGLGATPTAGGAGGRLNTSRAGKRTLTVTATSQDGETTSVTRSYTVVRPPNRFKISHIKTHRNGQVSFEVTVPGPGTINVLETDWNDNLVAQTARLLHPAPRRHVWARGHLVARHAGTYRFTVNPNTIAAATLARPRYKIRIRLWVSYTPSPGGIQRDVGFYGVPITP